LQLVGSFQPLSRHEGQRTTTTQYSLQTSSNIDIDQILGGKLLRQCCSSVGLTFELDPSASGTAVSASRHSGGVLPGIAVASSRRRGGIFQAPAGQAAPEVPAGVGGAAAGVLAWHAAAGA
jgi:hypothetical protein